MRSSPTSDCERLAGALIEGLRLELHLTPKPGLVDLLDSGSHRDLSLATMERSIDLVAAYFRELVDSLARGDPLGRQVAIGKDAERRMLEQFGTNTHKGAIFLGGLLLAARHRASGGDPDDMRPAVSAVARQLFTVRERMGTNGESARSRFLVGGIIQEAIAGLPSLFSVAIPAYRSARERHGGLAASFAVLAGLMQSVEDTTALHRCGTEGLACIRRDGIRLQQLVEEAGDYATFLSERNAVYRRMNLTMGGVADLLGIALGYLAYLEPASGS